MCRCSDRGAYGIKSAAHALDRIGDALDSRAKGEIGIEGRLIWRVDPGETSQLAGASAGVETLGIALLAQLEWGIYEYLDERQIGCVV